MKKLIRRILRRAEPEVKQPAPYFFTAEELKRMENTEGAYRFRGGERHDGK